MSELLVVVGRVKKNRNVLFTILACVLLLILSHHLMLLTLEYAIISDEASVNPHRNLAEIRCIEAAAKVSGILFIGSAALLVVLLSLATRPSPSRIRTYARPFGILVGVLFALLVDGRLNITTGRVLMIDSLRRFLKSLIESISGC